MTTVFSAGAGWATACAGLVGDGEWEEVEGPALVACAQETEHWHKMPTERRADKQVADFTAYASRGDFETWGNHDLEQKPNLNMARASVRTPRFVTTFQLSYPCFATSPWSTAFV